MANPGIIDHRSPAGPRIYPPNHPEEPGGAWDFRVSVPVWMRDGAVPLDILEENVRAWIAEKKMA